MWRMLSLSVVVCAVCVFLVRAQSSFRIVEAKTKARLEANRLLVNLATENAAASFSGTIQLDVLDSDGCIVADAKQSAAIRRGKQSFQIPLNLPPVIAIDSSDLLWYRLHYSIISNENTNNNPANGIISLSEMMPEIFELRASAAKNVFAGMRYQVRVRAFHPVTNTPTANVKITGNLKLDLDADEDEDELKLAATGTTDRDGFAVLNFTIPADAKLDSYGGKIELTGVKNNITREAEQDLDAVETENRVYLNTDKPIYQPNQDFHARGLLFAGNFNSVKAVGESELEFIIEDEDDTVLYRETVKTSRFGIASINWKIPENAKLGAYTIRVKDDDDEEIGRQIFKVSRYDLPNFTVAAKPDKPFYLPEQTAAEITVSADYLFGKPVTKGTIKVLRETERHWNYAEQKWKTEEETPVTGETGADGKFTAKFDLSEAHKKLKDSEWRRFEDLRFAAYFTDSTTNRTEAKRFDVRVTKDAIHVYLVGLNSYDAHNPKLPVSFYVSAYYADGAQAADCDVEIIGKYEDEKDANAQVLTRLKTNRFGAGKVEFFAPKRSDEIYKEDLQIKVSATDASNRKGGEEEEINMDDGAKVVRVAAKKAIYKPGEPVELEILSSESGADVFVDVVKDWSVVESRLVRTQNGRANLKIPYRPDFKGELIISAYLDDKGEAVSDARGIIYPAPGKLRLDVQPFKSVYRPNEEAKINFSVAAPGKKFAETALGVIVFDKAIEERAKSDADFGGGNVNLFNDYADLFKSKTSGGASLSAISEMDARGVISPELQLAAEAMLANENYYPRFFESDDYGRDLTKVFSGYFRVQFLPVETTLKKVYEKTFEHPLDENSLRKILSENDADFAALRDPWNEPYRAEVKIERDEDVLYIWSNGVNKKAEDKSRGAASGDPLVLQMRFKYFTPAGKLISQAAAEYHGRTGAFIRDYQTLRDELKKRNFDLDSLRDRWNHPYKINFGISQRFFTINFESAGANGKFEENYSDDFSVWTAGTDYFADTESRLQTILTSYAVEKKTFPKNEIELKEIFRQSDIHLENLRDVWNHSFKIQSGVFSRYADRIKTETTSKFGEPSQQKTTITPVTQQVAFFHLISAGADGKSGNYDDFTVASFSGVIAEQTKDDAKPIELKTETVFPGGKGAIHGIITDPTGAVIPNANVIATNEDSNQAFSASSDENGSYLVKNIPSGKYTIKAESPGFSSYVVTNIPVKSSNITQLDFSMQIGGISETVNVMGGGGGGGGRENEISTSMLSSSQIESLPKAKSVNSLLEPGNKKRGIIQVNEENSTPRLREYFPETLVWQPELVTDKTGKAELKFKLGDNITTWKIYTIASSADGKIGLAEKEIQAFQPFFVDLEPPKVLTVGDEISLPAQIRNYTEKPQKVAVSMASNDWFEFLTGANKQIEVQPNSAQNAVFDFRAVNFIKAGKQRVTALAGKDSDAIEKSVFVHPNGQEITDSQSEIFRDAVAFNVNFPAAALPKTARAELKIYPNLMAHVAESIEGILHRPYGCGEQTISSTYPNLMILKVMKNITPASSRLSGRHPAALSAGCAQDSRQDDGVTARARKFLQQGYEKLLGYQKPEGGFAVWTKDAPDVALTAYAIRFLTDAREFIDVDEDIIKQANRWLLSQQRADGSWTRLYSWEKTEDRQRTKILTTYIARSLAMTEKDQKEKSKDVQSALKKAFAYLKTGNQEIDEPFALANYALALFDAGETETASKIVEQLRAMAKMESGGAYWNLETNTPFYGWGTAGRIETTALVVQALLKDEGERMKDEKTKSENQNLVARGTIFLLKNKDRYGVWYSTQTTINVLDALLASLAADNVNAVQNRKAEIYLNGQKIKDVQLPPANQLGFPIDVALDSLAVNNNRVEIKINGGSAAMMAQVVAAHYVDWANVVTDGRNTNQSRQLRLAYNCDKRDAKIMDEVTCAVEAERIGFRGYGMLLAEIGLPPGADVDRASLEKAKDENRNFSRYDVLPDKIIVYLWAQAGGTKFNFKFKPRYGIKAQTAPSIVYDYYNPEAQATLAPLKFTVK